MLDAKNSNKKGDDEDIDKLLDAAEGTSVCIFVLCYVLYLFSNKVLDVVTCQCATHDMSLMPHVISRCTPSDMSLCMYVCMCM